MDTIGPGTGDDVEERGVSAERQEEAGPTDVPAVTLKGLITPRTQIVLIAIGIGLFNALLIGFLAWLIFAH